MECLTSFRLSPVLDIPNAYIRFGGTVDEMIQTADMARCFGLFGPHQRSADIGVDTKKKQAVYHIDGWLTFAE